MDISNRIKYFRTQKGITVNKLANLAGISQSYLRDIELGNKQPTVEYLSYICDGLGISLAAFFNDEKSDDELSILINKLNYKQRENLTNFLKSLLP